MPLVFYQGHATRNFSILPIFGMYSQCATMRPTNERRNAPLVSTSNSSSTKKRQKLNKDCFRLTQFPTATHTDTDCSLANVDNASPSCIPSQVRGNYSMENHPLISCHRHDGRWRARAGIPIGNRWQCALNFSWSRIEDGTLMTKIHTNRLTQRQPTDDHRQRGSWTWKTFPMNFWDFTSDGLPSHSCDAPVRISFTQNRSRSRLPPK